MAKEDKKDKSTAEVIDFSKIKEGGSFNKKRVPAGDYRAKITKVVDAVSKKDGVKQWLFTFETENGGKYPYYCKLQENQLWKVRGLLVAAGMEVPKAKKSVDPARLVGKTIGITLQDDEYEGKLQSSVEGVFAASEVQEPTESVSSDEEAEEKPKKKKGKKKDKDSMDISNV